MDHATSSRSIAFAVWVRRRLLLRILAHGLPVLAWIGVVVLTVIRGLPWTWPVLAALAGAAAAVVGWSVFLVVAGRSGVERRSAVFRIALVVGTGAVALVLLEIAGRFVAPADRGWTLNPPGLDVRFRTGEFDTRVTTNGRGLRGSTEHPSTAPGRVRIAAIGDSMTFGWGADDVGTYPAQAERALRATVSPAVDVLNFGKAGESPVGYLRFLRDYVARMAPDIVVVGLLAGNDCPVAPPPELASDREVDAAFARLCAPGDGLAASKSVVLSIVRGQLDSAVTAWRDRNRTGQRGAVWGEANPLDPNEFARTRAQQPDPASIQASFERARDAGWIDRGLRWDVNPWLVWSAVLRPNGLADGFGVCAETRDALRFEWRLCERILDAMATTCSALGADLVVLVVPSAYQVSAHYHDFPRALGCAMPATLLETTLINEWIAASCRERSIPCIDPLAAFRTHSERDSLFFARDAHLAPAGYRVLGEAVAAALTPIVRWRLDRSRE